VPSRQPRERGRSARAWALAAVVGGSALASDLILRRLALLVEHKPVVVSMSDLAASGGYYIAMAAPDTEAFPLPPVEETPPPTRTRIRN